MLNRHPLKRVPSGWEIRTVPLDLCGVIRHQLVRKVFSIRSLRKLERKNARIDANLGRLLTSPFYHWSVESHFVEHHRDALRINGNVVVPVSLISNHFQQIWNFD